MHRKKTADGDEEKRLIPSIRTTRRKERILKTLQHRQPSLTVVMEGIHDPHNVSAILRSCDAVGIMRVELLYRVEPFPEIGKKSSSSAGKWVERRKHRSVDECYNTLRSEGFSIFATSLERATASLYELDLKGKVALVFGNEHRGVSDEAADKADRRFKIPMMGMIESLNVSVACAVTLYEALRQRLVAGDLDRPGLAEKDLQSLFGDWVKR